MKLNKTFKSVFILIEKLCTRLPKCLFDFIHQPLTIITLPKIYSSINRKTEIAQLHATKFTDGKTFPCGNSKLNFILVFNSPPQTALLIHVFCLPDGKIISEKEISIHSSVFKKTSLYSLCKASYFFYEFSPQAHSIPEAFFIPRQFIDHFSWGDYVLETLYPLSWIIKKINAPIIVDNEKIFQYLSNDLKNLNIQVLRIPNTGIWVRKLHVVGSCQKYDNFSLKNILKFKRFYTELHSSNNQGNSSISASYKGVYLSRSGLKNINPKNQRTIKNEKELEDKLEILGFKIIHPHNLTNSQIIAALSGVQTIIGPWGSAFLHLAFCKPKNVIEIAHRECWGPACLKMGYAMGVENYFIYQIADDEVPINHFIDKMWNILPN